MLIQISFKYLLIIIALHIRQHQCLPFIFQLILILYLFLLILNQLIHAHLLIILLKQFEIFLINAKYLIIKDKERFFT